MACAGQLYPANPIKHTAKVCTVHVGGVGDLSDLSFSDMVFVGGKGETGEAVTHLDLSILTQHWRLTRVAHLNPCIDKQLPHTRRYFQSSTRTHPAPNKFSQWSPTPAPQCGHLRYLHPRASQCRPQKPTSAKLPPPETGLPTLALVQTVKVQHMETIILICEVQQF